MLLLRVLVDPYAVKAAMNVDDETGGGEPDEMEGSDASEEEELTDVEARHRLFDALEDDASVRPAPDPIDRQVAPQFGRAQP
jgi:hypothetical protein